jgi:parallel beta-helix repeat protein
MTTSCVSRARGVVVTLACAMAFSLCAPRADAKDCGGDVECDCGDRVTSSTVLSSDLNNCPDFGLELDAGVLDCAGHQIAGSGDQLVTQGVILASAVGAQLLNCSVRNFAVGVYIDGGSNNVLSHNNLFSNQIGVRVGDGSVGNWLLSNQVHDNHDEGIHIGGTTSGNLVQSNEILGNRRENLYLIRTTDNTLTDNLTDGAAQAGIHVKHSSNNTFVGNVVSKRGVIVRGDSSGNVFKNTQLLGGLFAFRAIEDGKDNWTFPHDNVVKNGRVIKASTCFLFQGAYDNTATNVLIDTCRPMQEKQAGDLTPYGNTVDVHYVSGGPGGGGGGGGGSGGGSGGNTDPVPRKGTIQFNKPGAGADALKVVGTIHSPTVLDALHQDVEITLTNSTATLFHVLVPAGVLQESGRSAKFEAGKGIDLPGVTLIEVRREGDDAWSFKLQAVGDLSAANEATMTLTWRIGEGVFPVTDTWVATNGGWSLG